MSDFLVNIVLPIASIVIPVFATVYTVNNTIKARNKENHEPYVVLKKVSNIPSINKYHYYITPVGRNYLREHPDIDYEKDEDEDLSVKLELHNIGYGVATNIRFYNLLTGNQIHGAQKSAEDANQQLFTTMDMQATEERCVQARILNLVTDTEDDHIRILCIYKDLFDNIYDFIISINAKGNGHYDFFAYQPSSRSYKKWKKECIDEYNKIVKSYKD